MSALIPEWVPWKTLAEELALSERQVQRRAKAARARVMFNGKLSRGVLRADVPLLFHVRRLDQ